MSAEAHSHIERPVRAAETVAAVVAALAVEQVAEGALGRLYALKETIGLGGVLFKLLLPLALVVTTVRFVHGNVVHLATEYRRWHHLEVPRNSLVAIPVSHFIDVVFHLLQYLCLVAAGYFLARDLRLVAISVGALLLLDLLWLLLFAALSRGASEQTKKTHKTWFFHNSLAFVLVAAIAVSWFLVPKWADELELTFALGLILAAVLDYGANYEHFFNQGLVQVSIELGQASAAVQYISALLPLTQVPRLQTPPTRDSLEELLKAHFAYFMADKTEREKLFLRSPEARLHVGIYIEQQGDLVPVFRYADLGIAMTHRKIPVGVGYVGRGYATLRRDQTAVHFYPRPDPQWSLPGQASTSTLEHYKSAMVTDVFWGAPGKQREAIGTLLMTSNVEDYFTRSVHESMLLGVSHVLTLTLNRHLGSKDPLEVRRVLLGLCQSPIVIEVGRKKGRSSS